MTEPTQADREAAAQAFFCKPLLSEKHNDDRRVRAFQRHREASTAALQARVETLEAENARLREAIAASYQKTRLAIGHPGDGKDGRSRQLMIEVEALLFPLSPYAKAALGGNDA